MQGSQSQSWWNQAARWLALAGVVGPILYGGIFTLAGLLRPGYSPVRQAVSALGVGTNAWLLNTGAIVFGALLFVFAVGFFLWMQQIIKKGMLVTCFVLLILSSIGAINTGIFPAASGTAGLHWTLGFLVGLLPLVIVYSIAGWQWRYTHGWRRYGWYSLATSLGTVVLTLLSFILLAPRRSSGGPVADIGGLIERALILLTFAWHIVIGWRLFALTGRHQHSGSRLEPHGSEREERTCPLSRESPSQ